MVKNTLFDQMIIFKLFFSMSYTKFFTLYLYKKLIYRSFSPNGPVTLCNFLINLSRNAVAREVAGELHSVTLVVSQFLCCRKRCTKFLVDLSSTSRNGLQQLATPLHSLSLLQQRISQFFGSFNKGACTHFLFFVPRSTARQVAERIAQCNRASTSNLGNLQRYVNKLLRKLQSVSPHKKKFSLSSYPAKKCHAGGRADFYFILYIFLLSVPLLLQQILKQ